MRKRLFVTLVPSVFCIVIACSSSSTSNGTATDAGPIDATVKVDGNPFAYDTGVTPPEDSSACLPRRVPKTAQDTATLALSGVNFGDQFADGGTDLNAWEDIGYNLDGACTTAGDMMGVCTPIAGAGPDEQFDGNNGIDNSFERNIIPIIKNIEPSVLATPAVFLDLQSGIGTVYISPPSGKGLVISLVNAVVVLSADGGGIVSGVTPTSTFKDEFRAMAGRNSGSLCAGTNIEDILTQVGQASDMGADGTQAPGVTCAGISVALSFTASQAASPAVLPADPCSD